MKTARCFACSRTRDAAKYLCPTCWAELPPATKQALYLADGKAVARFRQLLRAISKKTPLGAIEIS